MPHQLACRIDVSSFDQEQGGKGSVPNLFEGLILPSFYLYMVSACKINKKKQAYNTFATNLQQKNKHPKHTTTISCYFSSAKPTFPSDYFNFSKNMSTFVKDLQEEFSITSKTNLQI